MDWFLFDNGLRHARVNIRSEIWQRPLIKRFFTVETGSISRSFEKWVFQDA